MCYIIGSKSLKDSMDKTRVHYSTAWENDDVAVYKMNEPEHIYIRKLHGNLQDEDVFKSADGCMYAGLWDEATYNVRGVEMIGFVNEDKFHSMTDDEKGVYFEKKYASFSEWLSDVMDIENLMDGWAVLTYLAKKNRHGIKKFLETFEGGSKNGTEK